jgi:hypothetical protein
VKSWLQNGRAEVDIQLDEALDPKIIPDFVPFTLIIRLPENFFRQIENPRTWEQAS